MPEAFRVGVTRDFLKPDGTFGFGDAGFDLLEVPGLEWKYLAEDARELRAHDVRGQDALLVLGPRVSAASLEGADRLSIVARFGVGYDNVDVEACTKQGVLLTITPEGVRRPVAAGAVTFLLALAHKLLVKDRLTRAGRWAEKLDFIGMGVTGRTLGLIGLGNIGREIIDLVRPFGMRHLAHDPYAPLPGPPGVDLVPLDRLIAESDFVCITCTLTSETRHLMDAKRIALMKPTAYLINVARGPIVDQRALTEALRAGKIRGAGLDVFEKEPIDPSDPLLSLENVILAPHAISWTDECFREVGRSAVRSILEVAAGRPPRHVVNKEVLEDPRFKAKLERLVMEAKARG